MKKLATLSVVAALVTAAFVAGVAVGKTTVQPKFIAAEEVKWDDVGGPKLGNLTGDYKKGAYSALFKIPAGFTSPMHSHTGAYEAIEIQGTTSHWLKGEDGTKAKKMTPGSYWSMPAKVEHVSSCAPGHDCIFYVWQKKKFDFVPAKEDTATAAAAGAGAAPTKAPGAAAGAGTTKAPAGAGSAAPAKAPGPGAGSAPKAPAGAGSAAPVKK